MKPGFLVFFSFALIAATAGCGGDPVENLLLDPRFETIDKTTEDRRVSPWSFIQHAGEPSYEWNVEDGILTGRRVGPETDGHVAQTIPAQGFAGKTLRFSVELSGELQELPDVPTALSGIQIQVYGLRAGVPSMLGPAIMSTAEGSPPVVAGKFGWMVQEVVFDVPQQASSLKLAIRLGMNGIFRIRDPVLAIHP